MAKNLIEQVLDSFSKVPFVNRINNPTEYPVIHNKDNSISTHLLTWGQIDTPDNQTKYVVFPTIIYDKESDSLKKLNPDDAFRYNMQNKNYIMFDNPEEADYFTKHYKDIWNEGTLNSLINKK